MTEQEPMRDQPPNPRETRPIASRRQLLWPGIVLALLGAQMLLMLVMVYMATSDRSFAVEPDYYKKALHWDESAAEGRSSRQLGWSVRIEVGDAADVLKRRDVTCTLLDAAGEPLSGATVEVIAFPHARGQERTLVKFAEIGGGLYAASMPIPRSGLWEFRVTAQPRIGPIHAAASPASRASGSNFADGDARNGLVVSLLGSLHCVGMCGPLVAVAVGDAQVLSHATRRALLHMGYHGGRLLTYTLVGMLCGLLGARTGLGRFARGIADAQRRCWWAA